MCAAATAAAQKVFDEAKKHLSAPEVNALVHASVAKHKEWKSVSVVFPGFRWWLDSRSKWYKGQVGDWRSNVASYRSQKERHQSKVVDQLDAIWGRPTGKALQAEIDAANFTVKILPYTYAAVKDMTFNARVIPATHQCKSCGFRKGMPVLNDDGDRLKSFGMGQGGGVETLLGYTPWFYGPQGIAGDSGPGSQADEVLFHELVHCSRLMRGVFNMSWVNRGYTNAEEYMAVVLTNIYLSDKGQTVFRGAHEGKPVLEDADVFMDNPQSVNLSPRQLMALFRDTQPQFFNRLAQMRPRPLFNPARQFNDKP